MSIALIGGLLGLGIALVDLAFTKTALNVAGFTQLVLLPVIGYFVAPYVFGD
jgi:phosphate/sulfate permease